MIDLKTLSLITQDGLQAFALGRILDGIAALRTILPYCATETILHAEVEGLEKNYQYMLSFLRKGGDDQTRGKVQTKIQQQGISLLEQASRTIRVGIGTDHYSKALNGVSPDVIDRWSSLLTPEEVGDTEDELFDLLWTSPIWTAQDTARWYDFFQWQRDMVQQHLAAAVFLSAWEYYDAEKVQLLNLLADSECHRTHIATITYLLLLRLRYRALVPLMPPLPDCLLSPKGRSLIAQVQHEMLIMLLSEKDMEQEMKETEVLTQELISNMNSMTIDKLKSVVEVKGRYLKKRFKRGFDINLSKASLLHMCKYLHRISHWFMPFDKNHPLFQSVMINEKGRENLKFSKLVDVVMDCDVDKIATLYFVANDKNISKISAQIEEQEFPDIENFVIPEYSIRFLIQDLYRFFLHSPLHTQILSPFSKTDKLLDFPELAALFTTDECVDCCYMLFELDEGKRAIALLDDLISREGASVPALMLKGQICMHYRNYTEAVSCLRTAEVLQPNNQGILRLLSESYAAMHRFDEELEYLQRLSELYPEEDSYRQLIPVAMAKAGRYEEALQLFFKLDYEKEEDAEDSPRLVAHIADTALILGKFDVAERYTQKELQQTESHQWQAHLRQGHIKLLQGDWKSSLDSYEQFVNTYCKQTDKDAKAALAEFQRAAEVLVDKGISAGDIQLIRDILQSASEQ